MKHFLSLFLLFALLGCASGPMLIPESHLAAMAATEFEKIKQEMPISTDPDGNAQVARVSQRLADTLGSEMPEADWEYVLIENPAANAFAMPGGKIAVFTGLLDIVESDDELAAVVGHEIAHVLLRHANQRMSAEILRAIGAAATVVATDDMEDDDRALVLAAYGVGSQVGVMLPYSRHHESQADHLGLMIAARSGYDPRAAVTFWEKMAADNPGAQPEFLSTHPGYDTRIQNLRETMPEAMQAYASAPAP
jgi:predicted Zn-dependent protease